MFSHVAQRVTFKYNLRRRASFFSFFFLHHFRSFFSNIFVNCLSFHCVLFTVKRMVQKWAPLVWLAPGEKFFPSRVQEFLRHVSVRSKNDVEFQNLPIGPKSEEMFLVTKSKIGTERCARQFLN